MTNKNSQHPPSHGQALPAGTQLEEFVIERLLGVGGFGITYLAKDSSLGRQVVIKENLPAQFCWRETHALTVRPRHTEGEDADNFTYSLESFGKEAATLASLDHPGIVKVLRSFEANGTAYFVMPFVKGTALDEQIRARQERGQDFTEDELGGMLWRVLDALAHLHDRGIYHRDIKPGNILITAAGEPVLIDFGAARQRLSERSLTVIESAGYTPFEQLQTRGKIGPWSDIYALGATLYKAITGETPPKAADRAFDDPELPLMQRGELRARHMGKLLASIDKAMAPKASDRFQNASDWLEQIKPPAPMPSQPPLEATNLASQKPTAVVQTIATSSTPGAPYWSSGTSGWYYKKTLHQAFAVGPLPQKELVARISAGLLTSETYVLEEDAPLSSKKWRKVRDLPQLRIALKLNNKGSKQSAIMDARLQNEGSKPTILDTRWYYKTGPRSNARGPFTHNQLIARIAAGLVKPDHVVSDEKEPESWRKICTVPDLAAELNHNSNT